MAARPDSFDDIIPYIDLIRYAYFAYQNYDGAAFRSRLGVHELRPTELVPSQTTSTYAHLGLRDGALVIAFRGTDFPMEVETFLTPDRYLGLAKNVTTDLAYGSKQLPWLGDKEALVHEGFLVAFDGLRDDLRDKILTIYGTPKKIEICGHSLGGALATLCALWCAREWEQAEITCLTVASPRVGNPAFARRFREDFYQEGRKRRCYRLFLPHDVVPKIPNKPIEWFWPLRWSPSAFFRVKVVFPWKAGTWSHVGQDIQLQRGLLRHWGANWWWGAHFPSGYLETATRMCDARAAMPVVGSASS